MLSNLNNEVIFKKAFTNKTVFKAFVRDILGVDIEVNKIETSNPSVFKQLDALNIPHQFDVWAESEDRSSFVVIQRVTDDYKLGQFLFYCPILVQQLQKNVNENIYVIVVKTAPYAIADKNGKMLSDEVLLYNMNPKTLRGEVRELSNYQLVCVNPNHPDSDTPKAISDWLDFIYQSISQVKRPVINMQNEGISIAAELISSKNITSDERLLLEQESPIVASGNKQIDVATTKEMAAKMLALGMDLQLVAEITGLNLNVLKALISNNIEEQAEENLNNVSSEGNNNDLNFGLEEEETSNTEDLFSTNPSEEYNEENKSTKEEEVEEQIEIVDIEKIVNEINEAILNHQEYAEEETEEEVDNDLTDGIKRRDYGDLTIGSDLEPVLRRNSSEDSLDNTNSSSNSDYSSPENSNAELNKELTIEQVIDQIPAIPVDTQNNFREPGDDRDSWIELYNYLTLSNMAGISSIVHEIAHDYQKSAEERIGELKYLLNNVVAVKEYTFYKEASVSIVDGIDVIINLMVSYINRRIENIAKTLF